MTISENQCSGIISKGTMAFEGLHDHDVQRLIIENSSFMNNKSANGSAIYSSISKYITMSDLTIKGHQNTV